VFDTGDQADNRRDKALVEDSRKKFHVEEGLDTPVNLNDLHYSLRYTGNTDVNKGELCGFQAGSEVKSQWGVLSLQTLSLMEGKHLDEGLHFTEDVTVVHDALRDEETHSVR
jgi:hypothetical protein